MDIEIIIQIIFSDTEQNNDHLATILNWAYPDKSEFLCCFGLSIGFGSEWDVRGHISLFIYFW